VNLAAIDLTQLTVTQISVAAGGLVALVAYVILIVVPAWGSYGRWWERIAASFMTLFILITLVGIGAGIGAVIIYSWGRI
jgi:O-antigen ligase